MDKMKIGFALAGMLALVAPHHAKAQTANATSLPPAYTAGTNALSMDLNGGLRTLTQLPAQGNINAFTAATQKSTTTATFSLVVKTGLGAGILYEATVANTSAAGFLMAFNSGVVPADGAVTPAACVNVATGGTASLPIPAVGALFPIGITLVFSSTGCTTKTTTGLTSYIHASYE